jgi:hypothetical protein
MGTVIPRKRRDGSTAYQAQLLIKRGGKILHREGRTFDRKQAAAAWLEKRETELARPNALERIKATDPTLASVIDQYTEESIKQIGRTKGAGTSSNQEARYRQQALLRDHERRHRLVCEPTRRKGRPADRRQLHVPLGVGVRDREARVGLPTRPNRDEGRLRCHSTPWGFPEKP